MNCMNRCLRLLLRFCKTAVSEMPPLFLVFQSMAQTTGASREIDMDVKSSLNVSHEAEMFSKLEILVFSFPHVLIIGY